MFMYAPSNYDRGIDNPANILPLRSDLYSIFDDRMFVIVPKRSQYVTHFLESSAANYWPIHHNAIVRNLIKQSYPYLFARFAWAILFAMKQFVLVGIQRSVVQVVPAPAPAVDGYVTKVEKLSGAQLLSKYGGGGSKDATPLSKRTRAAVDDEDSPAVSDSTDLGDSDFWGDAGQPNSSGMGDIEDSWFQNPYDEDKSQQQRLSDKLPSDTSTKPVLSRIDAAELVEAATRVVASQEAGLAEVGMAA
jgi:hypothetical protein